MGKRRKWRKYKLDNNELVTLQQETRLSDVSLKILINNGFKDAKEIKKFLTASIYNIDFLNAIKDSDRASTIIMEAIKKGLKILVYGDYDADGVNATTIAVRALRALGATVVYYINDRINEGYGMCISGIDKMLEKHPDIKLIITVDNGISAKDQILHAKSKGLQVVVTDHHEVQVVKETLDDGTEQWVQVLPEADAIVNPKRKDDTFEANELCGAAVVWRLFGYLYKVNGFDLSIIYSLVDFAAVATVADVVSLKCWENRAIVIEGLRLMNQESRPLFDLMRDIMEVKGDITEETLAFQFAPLINAVSRMEYDTNALVATFLSDKHAFIYERIVKCKQINDDRKELTEKQMALVADQIDEKQKVLIVSAPGLKEGIIGLIAGRLKEEYNKPVIVFSETEHGFYKGSARSIEEFPIKENLDECSQYIKGYGGHPLAAGLSVEFEQFENFKKAIMDLGNQKLTDEMLIKVYNYVDVLEEHQVNEETYYAVNDLRPYGQEFSAPFFKVHNMNVQNYNYMGKPEPTHLKLISDRGTTVIGFRLADKYENDQRPNRVMLLGKISVNEYNGKVDYQVTIHEDNVAGC